MMDHQAPNKHPAKKKAADDDRNSPGIRKKDYPIVAAVAILALNVWAFNQGATLFQFIIVGLDVVIVYLLYTRFMAQYVPKRAKKGNTKAATSSTDKAVDKRGLFGIKTKHYPLLAGAVLLLLNVTAFRSGLVPFIAIVSIADLAVLYLAYRKYGLPWRRKR